MLTNQVSSNRAEAATGTGGQIPDANPATRLNRVKDVLHDPLTFVLFVWAVMFAVAGAFWILSQ